MQPLDHRGVRPWVGGMLLTRQAINGPCDDDHQTGDDQDKPFASKHRLPPLRVIERDQIMIVAAKKQERVIRFVPLLVTPAVPTMLPSGFDSALGRLGVKVAPYDGRRSYANWLEAAGIPRTRRKLYLGHGQTHVTDLYEWHEVKAFVADDRAKLLAYIGQEQRNALRVMK